MKSYSANYLIHMRSENLDLLDYENNDVKILELRKITEISTVSNMFNIRLSFKATDNVEALRMAAINTDQSILVFPNDCKLINYHVELKEKRWYGNKVLEAQFLTCVNLSA